jgi:capsular polysaccharide biosynthesis protein
MVDKYEEVSEMIDQEIDFLEYITVVLRNKYRILMLSITLAGTAFLISCFVPEVFTAQVQVDLIKPDVLGGVAPDKRRASEVMTMVEHGFVTNTVVDNYDKRILAKLRSHLFVDYFIQKNELLPYIFREYWDKERRQWIENFTPNKLIATMIFKKNILSFNVDSETNLVKIIIKMNDPVSAAMFANKFVLQFNEFSRNQAISDAIEKKQFLYQELKKTKVVEMRKSIYRLMEAQLVIKMLASSKKQYALEVIDPAVPPLEKSSPAKKKITVMVLLSTIFLSVAFLIGRLLFIKARGAIKQYDEKMS